MTKISSLLLAAGAVIAATPLFAADLPLRVPPPPMVMAPPPVEEFSGWYLRGDIGAGIHSAAAISSADVPADWNLVGHERFNKTGSHFIGAGVGYAWNSWFRTDITAEYRTGSFLSGRSLFDNVDGGRGALTYNTPLNSMTVLANAYIDLGTWYGLTPFIGAGVGFSRNMMPTSHVEGITSCDGSGVNCNSVTSQFIDGGAKTSLAWALMAGVAWDVSRTTKLEMGYRYMNMGSFTSGNSTTNFCQCVNPAAALVTGNLTSHDLRIGMRWMFNSPSASLGGGAPYGGSGMIVPGNAQMLPPPVAGRPMMAKY